MPDLDPEEPNAEFHRDRRFHGGASVHLDDEQLARLAEEERVEAGLEDYDPDEVPPATDAPPAPDITQSDVYEWEQAELRKRGAEGELRFRRDKDVFAPTHYDDE